MSRKADLLRRAAENMRIAKLGKQNYSGDEIELDTIGYNLQQCIEKILKFQLQQRNIKYASKYPMKYLYDRFISNNLSYPDELKPYWSELDDFESKSRYGADIVATRTVIDELFPIAEKLLKEQQELQVKNQEHCNEINNFQKLDYF